MTLQPVTHPLQAEHEPVSTGPGETVIAVQNLVKKYGELAAVDNVSFEVHRGEVFAFLGPNGAGKSTTIEILECLRPPTRGSVNVLGHDVTDAHEASQIKERIGVLPQDFSALDRLTVKENLSLFASMYDRSKNVEGLISLLALSDKSKTPFGHLSGGLKQRVGVAAALVNDPDVIFLDEPTTGLDPDIRRTTWSIIKGLAHSGKTVFLTTHYMEEAQELADRIGFIVKGKLAALSTPSDLVAKFGGQKLMVFKDGGNQVFGALRTIFGDVSMARNDVVLPFSHTSEMQEALSLLTQRGLSTEMDVKSPTMEDVFLKLTGFKITEGGEAT